MTSGLDAHIVAVLRSTEVGSVLSQHCSGLNGTKIDIQVGRLDDVRPGTGRFSGVDALLLDIDPQDADEVEKLKTILHSHFPQTPVVITAPDLSLQDIRHLMRLGVADFVTQPIEQNELITALSHAVEKRRAEVADAAPRGKIIAFCKSAGGVGATTLAVQAGCLIANQNKENERAACLIDLDLQFGTVGLYVDIGHCNDLPELADAPDRLDPTLLHGLMARHASGLQVLAAPRDVIPLDTLTPEFVNALLDIASREYGHVLLDMPGAWTDWTISALQSCDLIVLVTQLTVAGIRQARLQLNTMRDQGLGDVPTKVALNRFDRGWGKSVGVKEAESALGRKIDFFIYNDYETVSEAINQGLQLSKYKKRTKVEKSIRRLAEDLGGDANTEKVRQEPRFV